MAPPPPEFVAGGARFNGAMAVRPWMVVPINMEHVADLELQWGHGREAMDGAEAYVRECGPNSFNGAMAVRPWMAPRGKLTFSADKGASMGPWP